ncbi:MAG TPA: 2-amino-4-hydroxy-6-hydroxymethyldihydropteridine diphosphokinase [Gammaproteobacteria bacterium]|nr:2-amino-4-hydroxy-6-hydroxymethyldihydropteridine diphosphokinase [Gammaproteobacteria bacterium]
MPEAVTAWIGLGSNLEDPAGQLRRAFDELARLPHTGLDGRSPLYRSPPMGPPDQPDYVNAVARLRTTLAPLALLRALQDIEAAHGRVRAVHWGPRTLDLDLLLYGDRVIDAPGLQVPHPGLAARDFVLRPLADLAPDLEIPGLGPLAALLAACPAGKLEPLPPDSR